ncbi:hypothetical protein N0V88_000373 [Collariella sp. IMI 366227]|nr:hypothetical protein N0V88_000373 [Collariella sp. IMI 366227]
MSSSGMNDTFSQKQRDEQARGKDYSSEDEDSSDGGSKLRLGSGRDDKDFSKAEARQKAIAFLDSPELLMMYAKSTGVSVPRARLHFTTILCGLDDDKPEPTRVRQTSYRQPFYNPRHSSHPVEAPNPPCPNHNTPTPSSQLRTRHQTALLPPSSGITKTAS